MTRSDWELGAHEDYRLGVYLGFLPLPRDLLCHFSQAWDLLRFILSVTYFSSQCSDCGVGRKKGPDLGFIEAFILTSPSPRQFPSLTHYQSCLLKSFPNYSS